MPRKTSWHKKNIIGLDGVSDNSSIAVSSSKANVSITRDGNVGQVDTTPSVDDPVAKAGYRIIPTGLKVVKQTLRYDEFGYAYVSVTFEWDALDSVKQDYFLRVGEANED